MMPLPAIDWPLNAKCVYWADTGETDDFGKAIAAAPIEIDCRWDDEQTDFVNLNGEAVKSKAMLIVDRFINSGFVSNRRLSDLVAPVNDPLKNQGWEVQGYRITTNFDGDEALYEVFI